MADNELTAYLEENPRMIGVLFAIMLALTQAGNSAAAVGSTVSGP